jgi:hypothetical protein
LAQKEANMSTTSLGRLWQRLFVSGRADRSIGFSATLPLLDGMP